jgi:hypothetical protein
LTPGEITPDVDPARWSAHFGRMSDLRETDVLEIGREAALRLLGRDRVQQVTVAAYPDTTDDPAYHFMIIARQDPDPRNASRIRGELRMAIRDALLNRGDESYPYIRILSPEDWETVKRA